MSVSADDITEPCTESQIAVGDVASDERPVATTFFHRPHGFDMVDDPSQTRPISMRQQYHFRPSANGYYAWNVNKLVADSQDLAIVDVPLSAIAELDENYWFGELTPTGRAVAEHWKLAEAADLKFPILLCADGRLMDGMHRVLKAYCLGHTTVRARRLPVTPPPDYEDVMADDLPY